MFVAQKNPNGWTLFFAFGEIACGLWAFVAGLLASETWQILFGLAMVSVAQQTAAKRRFRASAKTKSPVISYLSNTDWISTTSEVRIP